MSVPAVEIEPGFNAPPEVTVEVAQQAGRAALADIIQLPQPLAPGMEFTNKVVAHWRRMSQEHPKFGIAKS